MDVAEYWKQELGLSPWEITVQIVTQADIPGNYAELSWHLDAQTATISISDPDTWPSSMRSTNMEDSIVHEMVHLCTAGLLSTVHDSLNLTEAYSKLVIERPTIFLAAALVRLRLAGAHEFRWERPPKKKRRKS